MTGSESMVFGGSEADLPHEQREESRRNNKAQAELLRAELEAMGVKNPVGMQMGYPNNAPYTVIGVTDNVIMGSPFEPVDPMMVFYNGNWGNSISIRLNQSAQLQNTLHSIETIFKK